MANRNRGRRGGKRNRPAVVLMSNPDGTPGPEDNTPEGRAKFDAAASRSFSYQVPRLPPQELELAYRKSGIIWKGINRKARDALKKGFVVRPDSENGDEAKALNREVASWMRSTAFKSKAIQALREMYVFGDGFLELGFDPDDDSADEPPLPGAEPVEVYNVDPYAIRPVKEHRPGRLDSGKIVCYLTGAVLDDAGNPKGYGVRDVPLTDIRAWLEGRGQLPRGVTVVHPERIVHFQVHTLREDPDALGISVIEAAYMNALSKMMGDRASGDILEWYAQGFFVLNIKYASEEELKKGLALLAQAKKERRNYFCGSERTEFDIKSPSIANVKPFYDNFYIELSAALEIPTMLLLGVQKGTVTGSETDTVEYYDDVRAFQELLFDAPMYSLMARVLRRTDFTLEWTPLYVDKQTEANLRFKDAQSATALVSAKLLTRRQAIIYLRDGTLPDPDTVPDDYVETPSGQPKADPGNPDEPRSKGEDPTGKGDAADAALIPSVVGEL